MNRFNQRMNQEYHDSPTELFWYKNPRSPTGPSERTPKPEYLITLVTSSGSVGKVPFNFWWNPTSSHSAIPKGHVEGCRRIRIVQIFSIQCYTFVTRTPWEIYRKHEKKQWEVWKYMEEMGNMWKKWWNIWNKWEIYGKTCEIHGTIGKYMEKTWERLSMDP